MVREQDFVSQRAETEIDHHWYAWVMIVTNMPPRALYWKWMVRWGIMAGIACAVLPLGAQEIPASALLLIVKVANEAGSPLSAEIALDDEVLGHSDVTGVFYLPRKPLEPGVHELKVSLLGYDSKTTTIGIPSDPSALPLTVSVQLKTSSARGQGPKNPAAQPKNYRVYTLFYATDRQRTNSHDPEDYYSGDPAPGGRLEVGTCDVSIPLSHTVGNLESPAWYKLEYYFDPERHVKLYEPRPMEKDPFFQDLAARVDKSKKKELLIFIHGYNVTFGEAARRTAQIAVDLDFDGAAIAYSWPSAGKFLSYLSDGRAAEGSIPHLEAFLAEIAERAHAQRVHLIAHSMGNRVMSEALLAINQKRRPQDGPLFREIVMAAPDVPIDRIKIVESAMLPEANRVTLYASRNDDALLLSHLINRVARAGEKIEDAVLPGIDAVDASAVRTDFLGHSYFAASMSVITDIKQLLELDATPQLRKLLPATLANLTYWIIPAPAAAGR
jgi:esterase/lipase superfamily enzyme